MRLKIFTGMALALAIAVSGPAAAERSFYSGYIGVVPQTPADQAKTYFDRAEVRHLLAQLEAQPVSVASATAALATTQTTLADLERLKLVRESNGFLHIAFPYFTAADMSLIHAVAAKYEPTLVQAYQARMAQLDQIVSQYPVRSVPAKRAAFVLVAGFGLNWDALDLLTQKNWRQPLLISGPGWQYGFWAAEEVRGFSDTGYYWGSTSFPADAMNLSPPLDFTFSSFGDPAGDPRMNLPDLLAMPEAAMTPAVHDAAKALGLKDDNELGLDLRDVVGLDRGRALGTLLFALRAGATTKDRLCAALDPSDAGACDGLLGLLAAAGYVKASDDGERYALTVPVFDSGDRALLDAALAFNRGIVATWLAQNYAPMHRELFRLTAVRQGIPYPALFSQIWHEIFGLAARDLAASGVIEDPRSAGAPWPGSVPVVWRTSLYRHQWQ